MNTRLIKLLSIGLFMLISAILIAQPNTDVFIMDLDTSDNAFKISNFINISDQEGYDSQPSFVGTDRLLYAGSENGQTDIQVYYFESGNKHRINVSTPGGEYSPTHFPKSSRIAAVRLDTTGLQRFYEYGYDAPGYGENSLLLRELEVAYFAFYNEETILTSILSENRLDLVIVNLKTEEVTPYLENTGRSIHKIPTKNAMSYTVPNEEGNMDVYQLDMADKESYFICQLPVGIQDHCWMGESKLLLGSGSKLFQYDLYGNGDWVQVADLSSHKLQNITRITVSQDGKKLALVAELSK